MFLIQTEEQEKDLVSTMAVGDDVIVKSDAGARKGTIQFVGKVEFGPGYWVRIIVVTLFRSIMSSRVVFPPRFFRLAFSSLRPLERMMDPSKVSAISLVSLIMDLSAVLT